MNLEPRPRKVTPVQFVFLTLLVPLCAAPAVSFASSSYNKTIGANVFGSISLVDTLPEVDLGIGGGAYFDYRLNQRYSLTLEAFAITQDGEGRSAGEGSIEFLGIPTVTFKIYLLAGDSKFDPYAGIGVGFYFITEGTASNNTGGGGLGAQVEVGFDYYLSDRFSIGVGGTFRSIGIINSLGGTANATTYMPYTLLGKLGYHF